MAIGLWKRYIIATALVTVTLLLDQITKQHIVNTIALHDGYDATSFLAIVHVRNPGAAFGLLANAGSDYRSYFFLTISALAALVLMGMILFSPAMGKWKLLGASFFLSGTLGNAIDRIRYGEVIDFLYFHIGGHYWPAFNIADSALCIGTAFFLISYFREPDSVEK